MLSAEVLLMHSPPPSAAAVAGEAEEEEEEEEKNVVRVRVDIIVHARIIYVGKSQSCMVQNGWLHHFALQV